MRVEPVGADDVSKTRTRFQDPNRRRGSHGHGGQRAGPVQPTRNMGLRVFPQWAVSRKPAA